MLMLLMRPSHLRKLVGMIKEIQKSGGIKNKYFHNLIKSANFIGTFFLNISERFKLPVHEDDHFHMPFYFPV